jgi:hypothetical protein
VSGEEIQDIKDKPPDIFNTLRTPQSWAYFRVAQFHDRPGHADQLHLDLWWRGLNIARDAGTYLYNADPPWNNSLTQTLVHNTVMLDGYEQMTLAGRFLYLDRAQGEVIHREQAKDGAWKRIEAAHDGYQPMGLKHIRSVTAYQGVDTWRVEDRIKTFRSDVLEAAHQVRLQWLLPDWAWEIEESENSRICLNLSSPFGWIALCVMEDIEFSISNVQASIYRGGDLISGSGEENPILGWVSPTYGVKQPALSLVVKVTGSLPITLISEWKFPHEEN